MPIVQHFDVNKLHAYNTGTDHIIKSSTVFLYGTKDKSIDFPTQSFILFCWINWFLNRLYTFKERKQKIVNTSKIGCILRIKSITSVFYWFLFKKKIYILNRWSLKINLEGYHFHCPQQILSVYWQDCVPPQNSGRRQRHVTSTFLCEV